MDVKSWQQLTSKGLNEDFPFKILHQLAQQLLRKCSSTPILFFSCSSEVGWLMATLDKILTRDHSQTIPPMLGFRGEDEVIRTKIKKSR